MIRTVVAVIVGFVAWFAISLVLGTVMRASWSAYALVADAMTFTLPMLFARLALGVVATIAAGWTAARIATHPRAAALVVGIVLLAMFIPQHVMLWQKFPLWYHAFFLVSLIPLAMLGWRLAQRTRSTPQLATS